MPCPINITKNHNDWLIPDIVIDFLPVLFGFGSNGLLSLELSDLIMTDIGSYDMQLTLKLDRLPDAYVGPSDDVNTAAPVPEPATFLLFGFGLIGIGSLYRKRLQK